MKKSRIFLAATLALGIAGAVAAKAHTTTATYFYYDPTNPTPTCISGSFADCPQSGSTTCTGSALGSTVTLYTATGCGTVVTRTP